MTTPNSEFNIVFGPDFSGFRHWDHKFEWTRKEFEDWSRGVGEDFGYDVEFFGIGDIPEKLRKGGDARGLEGADIISESATAEVTAETTTQLPTAASTSEMLTEDGMVDDRKTSSDVSNETLLHANNKGKEAIKWGDIGKCSQAAVFVRRDSAINDASKDEGIGSARVNSAKDPSSPPGIEYSQDCSLPKCEDVPIGGFPTMNCLTSTKSTGTTTLDCDPAIVTTPVSINTSAISTALQAKEKTIQTRTSISLSSSPQTSPSPSVPRQPLELLCEYIFPCAEVVDIETEKETQLMYYIHRMAREAFDQLEARYWRCAEGEQFEDLEEVVNLPSFIASGEDWPPEEVDVALKDLRGYSKLEALFPKEKEEVKIVYNRGKEQGQTYSVDCDELSFRLDALIDKVEEMCVDNARWRLDEDRKRLWVKMTEEEEEEEAEDDDFEWTQAAEDDQFTYG